MALFGNALSWLEEQFSDRGEETYQEPPTAKEEDFPGQGALPARSLRPMDVVILTPAGYADARRAVDELEQGRTVIVVLGDNVDDGTATRFVDFMSGAVYLAKGDIRILNADVLICTPDSVNLMEDRLTAISDFPVWR